MFTQPPLVVGFKLQYATFFLKFVESFHTTQGGNMLRK